MSESTKLRKVDIWPKGPTQGSKKMQREHTKLLTVLSSWMGERDFLVLPCPCLR